MNRITIFFLFCISSFSFALAQNSATLKGGWFLEANSKLSATLGVSTNAPDTGFGLISADGGTLWSIGAEGGFFVVDHLAIKGGLGYSDLSLLSLFTYKIGGKYFISGKFPVQLDLTGGVISDESGFFNEPDAIFLGIQGGYAIFITDNVSIEPNVRYNINLQQDSFDPNFFEFRIGFAFFFGS